MTALSLDDIKKKVEALATRIHAPADALPTYGYSRDFGYPHVEVGKGGLMHFVVMERGQELDRRTTDNLDALLYWIFSGATFSMACSYELKHRVEGRDSRRMLFEKQEEWLGLLNDEWQQKEQEAHKKVLEKYPFDDLASVRATYWGELRQRGYTEKESEKLAHEKYPKI